MKLFRRSLSTLIMTSCIHPLTSGIYRDFTFNLLVLNREPSFRVKPGMTCSAASSLICKCRKHSVINIFCYIQTGNCNDVYTTFEISSNYFYNHIITYKPEIWMIIFWKLRCVRSAFHSRQRCYCLNIITDVFCFNPFSILHI